MKVQRLPGVVQREVRDALIKGLPATQVAVLLHELNDAVVGRLLPVVEPGLSEKITCRSGCAHCCRQSKIMIDEVDAQVLANATGRELHSVNSASTDWRGVPCVFLDDQDRCSVYEIRPMGCRQSISIDDPAKCETEEYRLMVPLPLLAELVSVGLTDKPVGKKYIASRGKIVQDIRDFFPPEKAE